MTALQQLPAELRQLLEEMATEDNEAFSDDSISWKAYRIAEKLNDPELIPLLVRFLESDPDAVALKEEALTVIGYVLTNSGVPSETEKLADLLEIYAKQEQLLTGILRTLQLLEPPLKKGLDTIAGFTDDDREMVRVHAIRTLGLFTDDAPKVEKTLIRVLQKYYDKNDLRAAMEVLSRLGTVAAIRELEAVHEEGSELDQETRMQIAQTIRAIGDRLDDE